MTEYGTNKTEQAILKRIGATIHKNSGRGMKKGDGTWKDFTVDVKESKGYRLDENSWMKIAMDAMSNHNYPMLLLNLQPAGINTPLAVIELSVLEELFDEISSLREALEAVYSREESF